MRATSVLVRPFVVGMAGVVALGGMVLSSATAQAATTTAAPTYPSGNVVPAPVLAPPSVGVVQITSGHDLGGYVGQAFNGSVNVEGGDPYQGHGSYTWTAVSALPAGLTLGQANGLITGYPTATFNGLVKLSVHDDLGHTATGSFQVVVVKPVTVTSRALPTATAGHTYSTTLAATGGFAGYSWYGYDPAGLTLAESGTFTGTPPAIGINTYQVAVYDGAPVDVQSYDVAEVTLTVGPLPTPRTLHVPGDAATIGGAIAQAHPGDSILVGPGTYHERISFAGKAIAVRSTAGPASTIIDGGASGMAVTGATVSFVNAESRSAVLQGFTVRGGSGHTGGGIAIDHASPTIVGNVVTGNTVTNYGSGIGVEGGSPDIESNTITGNHINAATAYGSLALLEAADALVAGNTITHNSWIGPGSAGLFLDWDTRLKVHADTITDNSTSDVFLQEGGSYVIDDTLIANDAAAGAGFGLVTSTPQLTLLNDTIVNSSGTALQINGFPDLTTIENTIVVAHKSAAVDCEWFKGPTSEDPATFLYDDVEGLQTGHCDGAIASAHHDVTWGPSFTNEAGGDYTLSATSGLIDAGTGSAALPATDLLGNPRVVDGNHNGTATVDMGAYERQ